MIPQDHIPEWLHITSGITHKPAPPSKKKLPANAAPVSQYNLKGQFMKRYVSAAEASYLTGIDDSNIIRAKKGKRKTAGGYVWR